MLGVISYFTVTSKQGSLLNPVGVCNSKKGFQFMIKGNSDSDYAMCRDIGRSITGYRTFLNGSTVIFSNFVQKVESLSMTEAKVTA